MISCGFILCSYASNYSVSSSFTVQKSKKGTSQSLEKENSEEPPRQKPKLVIGGYVEDIMIMEPSSVELLQNVDDEAGNMSSDNENINGLQTDDGASDFYLM